MILAFLFLLQDMQEIERAMQKDAAAKQSTQERSEPGTRPDSLAGREDEEARRA